MTNRSIDANGYVTIARNPISRSGIFQYMGRSIGLDADPNTVYNVYRPAEAWTQEVLDSIKHVPWIDDHEMLGGMGSEYTSADQKGVHGITCDEVSFEDGVVYATLKIFSKTMAELIEYGKKQLSLGFRCVWQKASGVFDGQNYSYIQVPKHANHLATVLTGRAGPDFAVLDCAVACDTFDLDLKQGADMADETEEGGTSGMTLAQLEAMVSEMMPTFKKLQASLGATGSESAALDDEDTDEKKKEVKEKADEVEEKAREDEKKDKAEDKAAMDAAIESAVSRKVAAIHKDIARKNALYEQVSPMIGAFDHADKSEAELAVYACDKMGISAPKGQEQAYLAGYLTAAAKAPVRSDIAMDSATHVTGSKAVTDYFAKRN